MSASVSFNCKFCYGKKNCVDIPPNGFKTMVNNKWCYVSQKSADLAERSTYKGKKFKRNLTALEERIKEDENG